MAFVKCSYELKGVGAMLMHNGMLVDPLYEGTQKLSEITKKRKKTEADLVELARIEFTYGMYFDDKLGPILPARLIKGSLVNGAKKSRLGQQARAGIFVLGDSQLQYDGPRGIVDMWNDKKFVYRSIEKMGTGKIVRTRARFDGWSSAISLEFDDEILSKRDIDQILSQAGRVCGIGDGRPEFGRFTSTPIL